MRGAFLEIRARAASSIVLTGILAAGTVVLAVATFFLWQATKRLVEGAENTAERQLRAYVGVRSALLRIRRVKRHTRVLAEIKIVDAGSTTANKVALSHLPFTLRSGKRTRAPFRSKLGSFRLAIVF